MSLLGELILDGTVSKGPFFIPVDCVTEGLTPTSATLDGGFCWIPGVAPSLRPVYHRSVFTLKAFESEKRVITDDMKLGLQQRCRGCWDYIRSDGLCVTKNMSVYSYVRRHEISCSYKADPKGSRRVGCYFNICSTIDGYSESLHLLSVSKRRFLLLDQPRIGQEQRLAFRLFADKAVVAEGVLVTSAAAVEAFPSASSSSVLLVLCYGDRLSVREWKTPVSGETFVCSLTEVMTVPRHPNLDVIHMPTDNILMVIDHRFRSVIRARSFSLDPFRWLWIGLVVVMARR